MDSPQDDETVSTRDLLLAAQQRIQELTAALTRRHSVNVSAMIGRREARVYQWHLAPGFTVIQARNAFAQHGLGALKVHSKLIRTQPRKGWRIARIAVVYERVERL